MNVKSAVIKTVFTSQEMFFFCQTWLAHWTSKGSTFTTKKGDCKKHLY